MKLIEKHRAAKTGDNTVCEDHYFFNEHFAAVIDGATNVSGEMMGNLTPGQLSAYTIREALAEVDGQAGIEEIIEYINDRLQDRYKEEGIQQLIHDKPFATPSAVMSLYSHARKVVWMIGDCQCLIDNVSYAHEKPIDDITANARSMYLEAEVQSGKSIDMLMNDDSGFAAIQPLIQMQYQFQNLSKDHPYGYEVINGSTMALDRIRTVRVPENADELVLGSDGYPYLKRTLSETENALFNLLDEDPLCFRIFKSSKADARK
ncbi:hypothetical protein JCM19037_2217 [Geomicrobium sp. JCM 19037]|uniref:hypothetical protein n=1 Tax=Geomicrobium sp. JCM 19037 TaxID=1460634 RepID=UPI00045F376C|nr:hypothetical protein [Geomicrobium sp. JCM 19037]GAK03861.1 hypothetical protein JCM19037_2217 [Geomicrobium sp. JCM 19037]